jgi:uncharacterized phage-associated protein
VGVRMKPVDGSCVMAQVSAHDVAREVRRRVPGAGRLKIHKLLYYCGGWSVAWNGEPLFEETIEAWDQGPVVADLWHDEGKGRHRPAERALTGRQLAVLDYVVQRYGHLTGEELKALSHQERPWRRFADLDGRLISQNAVITHEALAEWFTKDAEFVAHQEEVHRLEARRDIYGFEGPVITPALRSATERVLRERMNQS